MEADRRAEIVRVLLEHFSSATEGDCQLIWNDVKGYSFEEAHRAIIEHRRERGSQAWRPDPARVKALAGGYYRDSRRAHWSGERTVDGLRRMNPGKWNTPHARISDRDVILGHYSDAWQALQDTPACREDPSILQSMRRMIYGHATLALSEIGTDPADAEQDARWCVGLQAGEKIHRGLPSQVITRSLPDVRGGAPGSVEAGGQTSYQAFRELERAERAERAEELAELPDPLPEEQEQAS